MKHSDGEAWFEPGQLLKLDPADICPRKGATELERLFLALALVFNDLKGVVWVWDLFNKEAKDRSGADPVSGEVNGVKLTLVRFVAGILHELLVVLRTSKKILASSEFRSYEQAVVGPVGDEWRELLSHAGGKTNEAKMLARIRSNGAFHYYQPKQLAAGFGWHFFERDKDAFNEAAMFSFGKSPFETRFYYADGAAGGMIRLDALACEISDGYQALQELAVLAHHGLAAILVAYLRVRNGAPFERPTKPAVWRPSSSKRKRKRRAPQARPS